MWPLCTTVMTGSLWNLERLGMLADNSSFMELASCIQYSKSRQSAAQNVSVHIKA